MSARLHLGWVVPSSSIAMFPEPTTQAGREAVKWPGLFAGETQARREEWVIRIEEQMTALLRSYGWLDQYEVEVASAANYQDGFDNGFDNGRESQ